MGGLAGWLVAWATLALKSAVFCPHPHPPFLGILGAAIFGLITELGTSVGRNPLENCGVPLGGVRTTPARAALFSRLCSLAMALSRLLSALLAMALNLSSFI